MNSPDVWIKFLTDYQTNDCGDRGYAHDQKKTDPSKGEVCLKSKRIHPSTVWTSCIRPGVTRNLSLYYVFFKNLHQKQNFYKI